VVGATANLGNGSGTNGLILDSGAGKLDIDPCRPWYDNACKMRRFDRKLTQSKRNDLLLNFHLVPERAGIWSLGRAGIALLRRRGAGKFQQDDSVEREKAPAANEQAETHAYVE